MLLVRLSLLFFLLATLVFDNELGAETESRDFVSGVSLATIQKFFPEVERIGIAQGRPVAARVYGEGPLDGFLSTIGYVFSVGDLFTTAGYSGNPFEIIVGVDMDGIVKGAILTEHGEPIIGNKQKDPWLAKTVESFSGLDVLASSVPNPAAYADYGDSSAIIMLESVYRAGRVVAVSRELRGPEERKGRRLDFANYRSLDWDNLLDMGAVKSVTFTKEDLSSVFNVADLQQNGANPIEKIYIALATPPLIGRNLLVERPEVRFSNTLGEGAAGSLIWIGTAGKFIPNEVALALTNYNESSIELGLRQGGWVGQLRSFSIEKVISSTPPIVKKSWLVRIGDQNKFDPTRPWSIEIRSQRDPANSAVLSLPYHPSQEIILEPLPHEVAVAQRQQEIVMPLWVTVWIEQKLGLAIMLGSFLALSIILVMQGSLARSPEVLKSIKFGFLFFTLVWLGWYAGAQLSIMHVLSVIRAPISGWSLDSLLLDPFVLGILGVTFIGTLLLGRGVFCGWLCPFGALQDLLSMLGKRLRMRQFSVPRSLNQRLWSVKYVVLIGLVGTAFFVPNQLDRAVEVEPFNTAILFHFVRTWPYTLFAIVILTTSLFVERAFCRYLCPLGASLAVAGKIRLLEWLKRRPECGSDCNICGDLCPVQAIGEDGEINFNECFQCLKCQVAFYDNTLCPPLVRRRTRRERLGVI